MHQKLLVSKYTAIRQLVYSRLTTALSIYTCNKPIVCTIPKKIPLSQDRDNNRIIYISGIALQLSKSEKFPAMEIANGIVSHISTNYDKDFKIEVVSPGWIHLEVTQTLLATWLQGIAVGEMRGVGEAGEVREVGGVRGEMTPCCFSSSLFMAQYAHARCCSLVRLAVQERLIKYESKLDAGESSQQRLLPNILIPNPIPWLNCDQKLRFHQPASYRLIDELVRVVDKLEFLDSGSSVHWEKAALDLSRAFETFWCQCRIFGEVKTASPELAQAKIGLVLVTQSVLKFLLEEKLGVFSLSEV